MRVLAVDTATARGSLAILDGSAVAAERRRETPDGHSRWLVAAMEEALSELAVEAAEVDAFAVTVGPGSFTGLRVGIATVQGLALAAGRPVVGLPTLDVLGRLGAGEAETVVALMDAFRDEVFAAAYDRGGRLLGERRVGRLEAFLDEVSGSVAFVGDGVERYRQRIVTFVPRARFPPADLYLAAELGRAALEALSRGEGRPPRELRPLYLRGAHIRPPRS